ncbi:MAG TPA: RluA family pseudouridine synthase [Planctomycetota bacterium]|nr:RluA family pseudouridine synthase [Planctomycetota bacterium]
MKPAGFAVGAERNKPGETPLLDAIAAALEVERVWVVHRLDRETSGVMLVATDEQAHRALSIAFMKRQVDKRYVALIRGVPHEDSGEVDAPLEKDPGRPGLMRIARRGEGKRSLTRWSVRARFRGYALLEVRPETGRMHQIRVHLRHAGLPLAVDPAYGGAEGIFLSELKRGYKPSRDRPEPPIIGRVTLHAESLAFRDPTTGEPVSVKAEPPKDLGRALDLLATHAPA